jgi:hypothetical protein
MAPGRFEQEEEAGRSEVSIQCCSRDARSSRPVLPYPKFHKPGPSWCGFLLRFGFPAPRVVHGVSYGNEEFHL